ncbi:MAG: hypothetical protein ACI9MC_002922, partial [Kiritimatiellia bacterium]
CGCGSRVRFECPDNAPLCDVVAIVEHHPRASDIAISRVALYQAPEVVLWDDGLAVEPVLPVVAGRVATVRVFVDPRSGWQAREIIARFLFLGEQGDLLGGAEATMSPSSASTQEDLTSTANILIPGAYVPDGTVRWTVELLETGSRVSGDTSEAFIDDGTITLVDNGGPLRLYLVPIAYNADGSGRLPDVSEPALSNLRAHMGQMYPVRSVEIEVGEVLEWADPALANTQGWSQLVEAVGGLRGARDLDPDVFIYGLFTPHESKEAYCDAGCVLGLATPMSGAEDAQARAAIGVDFAGTDQEFTTSGIMVHELGHTHGRYHAPCGGAGGPDPEYPHVEGVIGVWAYDGYRDALWSPTGAHDVMSYCFPQWVSDYSWTEFHRRKLEIHELYTSTERVAKRSWVPIWLHSDGSMSQGETRWLSQAPWGELTEVAVWDGTQTVQLRGILSSFEHARGGVMYVERAPTMPLGGSHWRLVGR